MILSSPAALSVLRLLSAATPLQAKREGRKTKKILSLIECILNHGKLFLSKRLTRDLLSRSFGKIQNLKTVIVRASGNIYNVGLATLKIKRPEKRKFNIDYRCTNLAWRINVRVYTGNQQILTIP